MKSFTDIQIWPTNIYTLSQLLRKNYSDRDCTNVEISGLVNGLRGILKSFVRSLTNIPFRIGSYTAYRGDTFSFKNSIFKATLLTTTVY